MRTFRSSIALLLLAGATTAFSQSTGDTLSTRPSDRFEGTRAMIKLLEEANAINYRGENQFATAPRIAFLAELEKVSPDNGLLKCQELINGGRQDEAIADLLAAKERHKSVAPMQLVLDRMLALAYLRQGEQDNCVSNHNGQSCLFPIAGEGVHVHKKGSRAAIDVYISILERKPDDLQSRWLLNVAYMTVGEYPDSVPARWLLSPDMFASDHALPRFTNIAPGLGIDPFGLAGGCCTEDFDLDGDIDILVSSMGMKSPMFYFRNNGDGTFMDATADAGLTGLTGGLNMIHGDYDNDGYPDVLVLRGGWMAEYGRYPKSLLRNNGDGTFSDVTIKAGLLTNHPSQTAVLADLNNDGLLDIFVGNESQRGVNPCELFVNNGDGTFTNRAHELGVDYVYFVKGVTCGDYDRDGNLDLYLSCQMQADHLIRNNGKDRKGKWTFTDVTEKAGVPGPVASFPTFFFDYDNDGWQDLFVSGYGLRGSIAPQFPTAVPMIVRDYQGQPSDGETPRLYRNNGNGTFTDVTRPMNLEHVLMTMGCNFGDLDNDGYLDFYSATGLPDLNALIPNRMFRNNAGKGFQDVTTSGGFGHLQKGHAVAFADLDNDGDQDIYVVMGGAYEGDIAHKVLFANPGNTNHWVTLKLEGVRSNRSAIGARIEIVVGTPDGDRHIFSTVGTGASFGSSTLQQEIGLGNAQAIRSITVTWPTSRTTQVFKDVAMDRFYSIREDRHEILPLERTVIRFKEKSVIDDDEDEHMHHHHK